MVGFRMQIADSTDVRETKKKKTVAPTSPFTLSGCHIYEPVQNSIIQIRRYKISVICSLVAGLIAGSVSTVLIRILPITIFQKVSAALAALPLLKAGNTQSVFNYGIPLLIGTAVFLIVLNMQEIHEIRSSGMQQHTSIRPTSGHR